MTGTGKTAAGNPYSNAGTGLAVAISRNAPTFTHKVTYCMGSECIEEHGGVEEADSLELLPEVWLPHITDRQDTTGLSDEQAPSVTVTTLNAQGQQVGEPVTRRFDIYVPDSFAPTVVIEELVPVNGLESPFDSLFIQGKSKVQATITTQALHGAWIDSCVMTVEGESYGAAENYQSGYLSGYGDIPVKVTVRDSRGFSATATATASVLAYSKPQLLEYTDGEGIVCDRCDASGELSDSGTYLKVKARRSYSKLIVDGEQKNFCQIAVRYKPENGEYCNWVTILSPRNTATNKVESGALFGGELAANTTYTVQVTARDTLDSYVTATFSIGTEHIFMHRRAGGKGMGLGTYCNEDDLLDVAWRARFRGDVLLGDGDMTLADYIREIIKGG